MYFYFCLKVRDNEASSAYILPQDAMLCRTRVPSHCSDPLQSSSNPELLGKHQSYKSYYTYIPEPYLRNSFLLLRKNACSPSFPQGLHPRVSYILGQTYFSHSLKKHDTVFLSMAEGVGKGRAFNFALGPFL